MVFKYYWIVLYTVHVTAFCLGGGVFFRHGVELPVVHYLPINCRLELAPAN